MPIVSGVGSVAGVGSADGVGIALGPKRVLIQGGTLSNIKVSLPGFDVTVADLTELAFDSSFANLEVYMRGTTVINLAVSFTNLSFGETLADPPIVLCSIDNDMPWINFQTGPGPATDNYQYVFVSQSGVDFITYFGTPPGGTIPVNYVIFRKLKG